MSFVRESCIQIYRWLTWSNRQQTARQLTEELRWPAAILFYHRVAEHDLSDWTITPSNFARHLDFFTQIGKVVSLQEIQKSQTEGKRSQLEIAITFDDGYFETTHYAIPLLIERGLNCTYFASTHYAESGLPFPHDVARKKPHPPNTIEQLRWMAGRGVEIGCHTHTHANLANGLSRTTLRREIIDSRKRLQDWTGQPIHYFAFPYGMPENMSHDAIDMVYEAGFAGFLSAYGDWNFVGDNAYHLRRIHGLSGIQSVANWLTLDPRKFTRHRNVAYLPRSMANHGKGLETALQAPPWEELEQLTECLLESNAKRQKNVNELLTTTKSK